MGKRLSEGILYERCFMGRWYYVIVTMAAGFECYEKQLQDLLFVLKIASDYIFWTRFSDKIEWRVRVRFQSMKSKCQKNGLSVLH